MLLLILLFYQSIFQLSVLQSTKRDNLQHRTGKKKRQHSALGTGVLHQWEQNMVQQHTVKRSILTIGEWTKQLQFQARKGHISSVYRDQIESNLCIAFCKMQLFFSNKINLFNSQTHSFTEGAVIDIHFSASFLRATKSVLITARDRQSSISELSQ